MVGISRFYGILPSVIFDIYLHSGHCWFCNNTIVGKNLTDLERDELRRKYLDLYDELDQLERAGKFQAGLQVARRKMALTRRLGIHQGQHTPHQPTFLFTNISCFLDGSGIFSVG